MGAGASSEAAGERPGDAAFESPPTSPGLPFDAVISRRTSMEAVRDTIVAKLVQRLEDVEPGSSRRKSVAELHELVYSSPTARAAITAAGDSAPTRPAQHNTSTSPSRPARRLSRRSSRLLEQRSVSGGRRHRQSGSDGLGLPHHDDAGLSNEQQLGKKRFSISWNPNGGVNLSRNGARQRDASRDQHCGPNGGDGGYGGDGGGYSDGYGGVGSGDGWGHWIDANGHSTAPARSRNGHGRDDAPPTTTSNSGVPVFLRSQFLPDHDFTISPTKIPGPQHPAPPFNGDNAAAPAGHGIASHPVHPTTGYQLDAYGNQIDPNTGTGYALDSAGNLFDPATGYSVDANRNYVTAQNAGQGSWQYDAWGNAIDMYGNLVDPGHLLGGYAAGADAAAHSDPESNLGEPLGWPAPEPAPPQQPVPPSPEPTAEELGCTEEELQWVLGTVPTLAPAPPAARPAATSASSAASTTSSVSEHRPRASPLPLRRASKLKAKAPLHAKGRRVSTMHERFHTQADDDYAVKVMDCTDTWPEWFPQVEPGDRPRPVRRVLAKFGAASANQAKWKALIEACEELETLAQASPEIVVSSVTAATTVVLEVVAHNRPAVVKAAIRTLGVMIEKLGPCMDNELERVIRKLLKKTAAATGSSFILNEVGTALDNACMNCSVDRMMPTLLKMLKIKEAVPRMLATATLAKLIDRADAFEVHSLIGELLRSVAVHLDHASFEVQHYSSRMLFKLTRKDGWRDSLLEEHLCGERLHVAKAALLRLQSTGPPLQARIEPRRVSSFTTPATTTTSPTRRSSLKNLKHKLGMEPDAGASRGDLAKLARMKSDLAVGNWRAREKTLIELDGLLSAKAKQMKDHAPSVIKNMVLPWCQDTNTKVSLTALALLLNIIPLYHAAFTSMLTSDIVKKLANGMSATNAKIIEVTSLALDNMIVYADTRALIKPWVYTIETGNNVKVQTAMLNKLRKLAALGFNDCPDVFAKSVLPLACQLLTGTKFSTESRMLCRVLFAQFGETLFVEAESLPANLQAALVRFVDDDLYRSL